MAPHTVRVKFCPTYRTMCKFCDQSSLQTQSLLSLGSLSHQATSSLAAALYPHLFTLEKTWYTLTITNLQAYETWKNTSFVNENKIALHHWKRVIYGRFADCFTNAS